MLLIPPFVQNALIRLRDCGIEAYAVGGCVRDALLGTQPTDYDIAAAAPPERIIDCFKDMKLYTNGIKHGTVTVCDNGGRKIQITSYRRDGTYSDGRRPDCVSFVTRLSDDLRRRDFTINAMAYNDDGLVDLFGGQRDLDAGIIRCVGNARDRFSEDSLRILRALRFAARLGFDIEPESARAMRQRAPLLENISAQRIFGELCGIVTAPHARSVLLEYADIIGVILPEIKPCIGYDFSRDGYSGDLYSYIIDVTINTPPQLIVRLAALFHAAGIPMLSEHSRTEIACAALTRLCAGGKITEGTAVLLRELNINIEPTTLNARRLVARYGYTVCERLTALKSAICLSLSASHDADDVMRLARIIDGLRINGVCLSADCLEINGDVLIALGFEPGKRLRAVLDRLLELVVDGELENDADALRQAAARMLIEE